MEEEENPWATLDDFVDPADQIYPLTATWPSVRWYWDGPQAAPHAVPMSKETISPMLLQAKDVFFAANPVDGQDAANADWLLSQYSKFMVESFDAQGCSRFFGGPSPASSSQQPPQAPSGPDAATTPMQEENEENGLHNLFEDPASSMDQDGGFPAGWTDPLASEDEF